MLNHEDLQEIFKNVDESKRQIIETMFDDFIHEAKQLEEIKPLMSIMPKSTKEASKVKFYTKMYADISQRHDSKIKIFLSVLGKYEAEEEDEFVKWLNENQKPI